MNTDTMTLADLERLAKDYSQARDVVAERVGALDCEIADAKRRKVPGIKSAVRSAKDKEARLFAAIEAAPHLFSKPKTQTFHGVKIGYAKGKGKLVVGKPDKVIALIKKHLPEVADRLIEKKETLNKRELAKLAAPALKRIGCEVSGTGEYMLIKCTDSEIDKLVEALLAEQTGEEVDL